MYIHGIVNQIKLRCILDSNKNMENVSSTTLENTNDILIKILNTFA